ncbi:aldo/keto reductase [Microcoleus sp. S28C3]|uniref:aldo/keto reductase n=1 Tax=Microcoleus sp. S28C3 TaxID=3055414 RepID=UPI002FD69DB2
MIEKENFHTSQKEEIPSVFIGTGTFGTKWGPSWTMSKEEAFQIMDYACENSILAFDSANVYNQGESQRWLGDYISSRRNHSRVYVSTKVGYRSKTDGLGNGGLSKRSIISSAEDCLKALRVEQIDLLYLHVWDRITHIDESLEAVVQLVERGIIGGYGLCNVPAWYASEACAKGQFNAGVPLKAVQLNYSLVERGIESEWPSFLATHDVNLVAWGVLSNGILSGKYRIEGSQNKVTGDGRITSNFVTGDVNIFSKRTSDVLKVLRDISISTGYEMSEIAIAWAISKGFVSSVVLGVSSLGQLKRNLKALSLRLEKDVINILDESYGYKVEYPYTFYEFDVQQLVHGETIARRLVRENIYAFGGSEIK